MCADLVEVRKKYSEEKSVYFLTRLVNAQEKYFLRKSGVFYGICLVVNFDRDTILWKTVLVNIFKKISALRWAVA